MLHITNARSARFEPIELLLDGSTIAAVGERVDAPEGCDKLDARENIVVAGILDMHVHLRDPGFTHKEDIATGGAAAVAGGVTAVACMPNTKPAVDSPDTLRYVIEKAAAQSPAKVHPIAAITLGEKGETLVDLETLARAGAVAFSDDGMPVMNRERMREAMIRADRLGKLIISHCEDFNFTAPYPASKHDPRLGADLYLTNTEESMAARDIALSLETGCAVHIAHISTAVSAELVRRAKQLGARVSCETCPHYLLLTEAAVAEKGTNAKMNPPLRTPADREAIIRAVCDGTVDALVTDHAPHAADEKAQPLDRAPNGIIGLETLVGGALTALRGKLAPEVIFEKMSAAPRRLLGLAPQGLAVGDPADLTLVDPDEKWTLREEDIRSKSHNSPFIGCEFIGRANVTIVDGKIVFSHWKD